MASQYYGSYRATFPKARKNGPRGVARKVRAIKHEQAIQRNANTPEHKRKAYRRAWAESARELRELTSGASLTWASWISDSDES